MMRRLDLFPVQRRIFERIARLAAGLSAPARLSLVQALAQGPKTVETLAMMSRLSVANTSQHLQKMVREGLVIAERRGVTRVYQLSSPEIAEIWEHLQDLAQVLDSSLEKLSAPLAEGGLHSTESLSAIHRQIADKKALLLDIRTEAESKATPVPAALSMPDHHLRRRLHELPKRKPIYVLCRGRYCIGATYAVRYLRRRGYRAFRLPHSSVRLAKMFR